MGGISVVSGLASGLDWRNIIDQLRALEQQKIQLIEDRKQAAQDRISAWQSINTKLLALKTAADSLNATSDLSLFTPSLSSSTATDAEDILSVTTSSSASRGSYQIVVNSLATAEKRSSMSFASDTTALGLSGDIIVNGKTVTLSATDTLAGVRDKFNAVNTGTDPSKVTASIVKYADGDYRLTLTSDEEGAAGISLVNGGAPDLIGALGLGIVRGVTGDKANTSGGVAITASTLIKDITGYTTYQNNDQITLSGTSTTGASVNYTGFRVHNGTTVQDLLNEIETRFGDVTAEVTADGKIQVIDNEVGDDQLVVVLTPQKPELSFDTDNNLGSIYTISSSQIQVGADASFTLDGVAATRSSNTVDDMITGVTFNLKRADPATTVTVNVGRDYETVKEEISGFVDAYNDLMDAINTQLTYDVANQKPGGPLYGDSTLRTVKSSLTNIILTRVSGVDPNFSTIGLIGIHLDKYGKLSIDDDELQGYLETNFNDVQSLFAANWSSTNSDLKYVYHSVYTQAGTYNVQITGVSPVAGYFSTPGDASASGNVLTGISGNAKGLVVQYAGAATGAVGSFTLTLGVAELLNRGLYQITDSTNGFLPDKLETIQNTIQNYDEDIARMQARVDQKMADLERRFVAMETALSTLRTQSDWLSGQIDSLSHSWG